MKESRGIETAAVSAEWRARAFTLIELLVVVAIIALLISILLPSLSRAREQAKAAKCGANLHSVGLALAGYLAENRAAFPLSYYYASDPDGGTDINNQSSSIQWGYVHWSWFLFSGGKVQDEAFQCPTVPDGGLPRTFPGPDGSNWKRDGQVDGAGNPPPATVNNGLVQDRQARWMAYTANAAIMPRNKLGNILPEGSPLRRNKFVRESDIREAGRTIVATEFNRNWKVLASGSEGTLVSKSHRPLNPFYNESSGFDEYACPPQVGIFRYWPNSSDKNYGLWTLPKIEEQDGGFADVPSFSEMNYVGRHHPGGDKLGGTANFLYVDGHTARKPVLQTLVDREWGRAYYGLTGKNECYTAGYEYMP